MQHDRDYYRSLGTRALIDAAKSYGLNEEMAIAIVERLEDETDANRAADLEAAHQDEQHPSALPRSMTGWRTPGHYHFNHSTRGN